MYTKIAAVAALFASSVLAQIPGLPDCAQTCVTDFGPCNALDVACICTNEPLLAQWSCCVNQQCDAAGVQAVISFADSICSTQNAAGSLPQSASCSGISSAAPTSSSTSASGSSTPTSTPTGSVTATTTAPSGSASAQTSAAAAPTNMAQKVLGLGVGAVGLLAAL